MTKSLDEMDRLCAEKVMGWFPKPNPLGYEPLPFWIRDGDSVGRFDPRYPIEDQPRGLRFADWQPTRNIAQAWELLEKLGSRYYVSEDDAFCHCKVFYNLEIFTCVDQTVPIAITKACLKAKGVEVE